MGNSPVVTIGDIARQYDIPVQRVRRLFERGILPPAARIGQYRVIPVEQVPAVEEALREAGYLKRTGAKGETAVTAETEPATIGA